MPLITLTPYRIQQQEFFFIAYGATPTGEPGKSVKVDSQDNIYIIGETGLGPGTSQNIYVSKYSPTGIHMWSRAIGSGTFSDETLSGIYIDSSDNIFIALHNSPNMMIMKLTSSGLIQWQREVGDSVDSDRFASITVDNSGSVIITGMHSGNVDSDILTIKYNSAGVFQWAKRLTGTDFFSADSTDRPNEVVTDSADNIYVSAGTSASGPNSRGWLLVKYNSAGVLQFQTVVGEPTGTFGPATTGMAISSTDDIYIVTKSFTDTGNHRIGILKYDTSGTLVWNRYVQSTQNFNSAGLALDSAGDIFIVGETDAFGVGNYDTWIGKFNNTNGAAVWQRLIGGTNSDRPHNVILDSSDNIIITGETFSATGTKHGYFTKLPGDGSLTGSYLINGNALTYQTITFGSGTLFWSTFASTLTDSVPTLTEIAGTASEEAVSFTEYRANYI